MSSIAGILKKHNEKMNKLKIELKHALDKRNAITRTQKMHKKTKTPEYNFPPVPTHQIGTQTPKYNFPPVPTRPIVVKRSTHKKSMSPNTLMLIDEFDKTPSKSSKNKKGGRTVKKHRK